MLAYDVISRPSTTSASTSVQGPWQMAPMGLFASANDPDELHGGVVRPQLVRVDDAAGQYEPVVVGRVSVRDDLVHLERVELVELVLDPLNLALLEGHELGRAARLLHGLPGFGQFGLLHAVGGEERDLPAIELAHLVCLLPKKSDPGRLTEVATSTL